MPNASVSYTGNGSEDTYTIPFGYLQVSDLSATINGVANSDWSINSNGSLVFDSAPADSAAIVISRDSKAGTPYVEWEGKSIIRSADLDNGILQLHYLIEELEDRIVTLESA